MYGKLATTCFKYRVYLYGSEAFTYLNAFLWVEQSQHYEPSDCPHPHLQAALSSRSEKNLPFYIYPTNIKQHFQSHLHYLFLVAKKLSWPVDLMLEMGQWRNTTFSQVYLISQPTTSLKLILWYFFGVHLKEIIQ